MSETPDLELLQSAVQADPAALEELLSRHTDWLWAYVRKHLGPSVRRFETSGDIVRETFRRLLEQGPFFVPRSDDEFRRLVARIVLNRIIDVHRWGRQPGRRPAQPDDDRTVTCIGPMERSEFQPSRVYQRNEEEARTRLALELCAPDDAFVLRLRFFEELSFEEIAARLEVAPDAARMRTNRARVRLAKIVVQLESGDLGDVAPDIA